MTSESMIVYTDGACLDNGTPKARGGFGVFFGQNDPRNCHGPLAKEANVTHTNHCAELYAIRVALQKTREEKRKLIIRSDSDYAMEVLTKLLPTWRSNGWKMADNSPVPNRELVESIDQLIKDRGEGKFAFEKVDAHKGDLGNKEADRLADLGAKQEALKN